MALIEFINYVQYTDKSSELFLTSQCPRGKMLEGDFLSGVPDIYTAKQWLRNAIEAMERLGKYKSTNWYRVKEEDGIVFIESTGNTTGKKKKICGYKKL